MKILEVGAGTGGATRPILETLARQGGNESGTCRFGSYDFIDISPSVFEKAKETFHYAIGRMNFKVLNIEIDPVQQGFESEQYDMIVAANVFHATKSIDKSLQHVRKLLKPGGKLILYEITNATLMQTGFGFGLLPGWWLIFILLSSGSGIVGNGGQANYCIGNAYQDALARYRVTNGHKATVLDLGIILSVGYAAEKVDVMGHLRAQGYAALREEEYHAMLDELCDPALGVSSVLKSQISLGFELPETLRAKGIDFPGWMHDPLFRHLFQIRTRGESVEDAKDSLNYAMLLAAAETRDAAETVIVKWHRAEALQSAGH